jgi:hypothetical protein
VSIDYIVMNLLRRSSGDLNCKIFSSCGASRDPEMDIILCILELYARLGLSNLALKLLIKAQVP